MIFKTIFNRFWSDLGVILAAFLEPTPPKSVQMPWTINKNQYKNKQKHRTSKDVPYKPRRTERSDYNAPRHSSAMQRSVPESTASLEAMTKVIAFMIQSHEHCMSLALFFNHSKLCLKNIAQLSLHGGLGVPTPPGPLPYDPKPGEREVKGHDASLRRQAAPIATKIDQKSIKIDTKI